jgi:hypothetical protein
LHRNKIIHIIVFLFHFQLAPGQSIQPNGRFLESETKIGEEVRFALSARYDKSVTLLFPDSLYRFGTFEYNSRQYFPTKTDSLYSYDSVVYNLSTFEIDTVQYLQLPVFAVEDGDSLAIFSNMDSISLIQVVDTIPETPELLANTDLVKIDRKFNYPYFLIGTGIVFIIGLAVALFFGKQLLRWWKIMMMRRAHKKFTSRFFQLIRDISGNNPANTPEHVLAFWKRYLEKLEKKPVSKLTTKEILVLHNNSTLKENLKTIDRSIYGGEKGNDLFSSFDYLMRFSVDVYNDKIREIKHN